MEVGLNLLLTEVLMTKRIKKMIVYKYYYNNGFKVDEMEYREHKKTIFYVGGVEQIDELLLERVNYSTNFPIHLNFKHFNLLQTDCTDDCCMYSLKNDEETLDRFKELYKGLVKYNISHLTAFEEDAHKRLDKWISIEMEMRHQDDKR